MTQEEECFHRITDKTPNTTIGKVFGAVGIKMNKGKIAAIFWKGEIIIKLNEEDEIKALKLSESRPGTHLYATNRKMKIWVTIPFSHSDKWEYLIKKSILNLNKMN